MMNSEFVRDGKGKGGASVQHRRRREERECSQERSLLLGKRCSAASTGSDDGEAGTSMPTDSTKRRILRVVSISGEHLPVDVDGCTTVADLRSRTALTLDVEPWQIRLVLLSSGQHNLLDTQSLGDTDVDVQAVIIKIRPGVYVASHRGQKVSLWPVGASDGDVVVQSLSTSYPKTLDWSFNVYVGICVDADGAIYLAECENSRIMRWMPGANRGEVVAGGKGKGEGRPFLQHPTGILIDGEKSLYVVHSGIVTRWPKGGGRGEVVAGNRIKGKGKGLDQLGWSEGISVDSEGSVYVAESDNHRVTRWRRGATEGEIVAGANGQGAGPGQLSWPCGIFIDRHQSLYIAEAGNHRVSCWTHGANCGKVVAGGHGNGDAPEQLSNPRGIFVDDLGAVYVAEYGNHRVSRWAPGSEAGEIVAGGNGCGDGPNQLMFPSGVFVV